MEFTLPIQTSQKQSIWDNDVPIVKTEYSIDAYLSGSIEEPFIYNELCHVLRNAKKFETVCLYLNTPGGYIDSAFQICDAIKNSDAKVIAYLNGSVASAGTIITLACDELIVGDHTAFMIHNYSGGLSGKGHEMKARQEFTDKSLNETFKVFYKGFLSDHEMEEVIDGKDMWMGKEEILERWAKRLEHLNPSSEDITPLIEEDHH